MQYTLQELHGRVNENGWHPPMALDHNPAASNSYLPKSENATQKLAKEHAKELFRIKN